MCMAKQIISDVSQHAVAQGFFGSGRQAKLMGAKPVRPEGAVGIKNTLATLWPAL
jgi:hypothetical protein